MIFGMSWLVLKKLAMKDGVWGETSMLLGE